MNPLGHLFLTVDRHFVGSAEVHCLMLGLGSRPLFIRDLARAVGTLADVVEVTVNPNLPVDSRPLWRGAVITEVTSSRSYC